MCISVCLTLSSSTTGMGRNTMGVMTITITLHQLLNSLDTGLLQHVFIHETNETNLPLLDPCRTVSTTVNTAGQRECNNTREFGRYFKVGIVYLKSNTLASLISKHVTILCNSSPDLPTHTYTLYTQFIIFLNKSHICMWARRSRYEAKLVHIL